MRLLPFNDYWISNRPQTSYSSVSGYLMIWTNWQDASTSVLNWRRVSTSTTAKSCKLPTMDWVATTRLIMTIRGYLLIIYVLHHFMLIYLFLFLSKYPSSGLPQTCNQSHLGKFASWCLATLNLSHYLTPEEDYCYTFDIVSARV